VADHPHSSRKLGSRRRLRPILAVTAATTLLSIGAIGLGATAAVGSTPTLRAHFSGSNLVYTLSRRIATSENLYRKSGSKWVRIASRALPGSKGTHRSSIASLFRGARRSAGTYDVKVKAGRTTVSLGFHISAPPSGGSGGSGGSSVPTVDYSPAVALFNNNYAAVQVAANIVSTIITEPLPGFFTLYCYAEAYQGNVFGFDFGNNFGPAAASPGAHGYGDEVLINVTTGAITDNGNVTNVDPNNPYTHTCSLYPNGTISVP